MKKPFTVSAVFVFFILAILANGPLMAQTTVTGSVYDDATEEPLVGVNVIIVGTVVGTVTDQNGAFTLTARESPPFELQASYVGYQSEKVRVDEANANVDIRLKTSSLLGDEVVVSASRVQESILQSPVSIEKLDILDIQNAPSANFYASLKNLNGVDFSTQSLTFSSVNVRGFASNGNTRFVQLIDGIDNQAPGLNFSVGNVVGINELDLESAELIPGAASALYGPNAIQGILLMNSKSPFEYQGLDIYAKTGVNHIDGRDDDPSLYTDIGFRYGMAINEKFAFKLNGSWLRARDFIGVDRRDQSGTTVEANLNRNRSNNRVYDGVNVYGDFLIDIGTVADIAAAGDPATAALLAPIRSLLPNGARGAFSPTGYAESEYVDNTAQSLKFGAAFHYRITDKIETILQANYGQGSSVYTANDRFVLDNFSIWTGKVEVKGNNFFVRGYTTQENSGDTYAANTVAALINQKFYLPAYFGAWVDRLTGRNINGTNPDNIQLEPTDYEALHRQSRAVADAERPAANSKKFQDEAARVRALSIAEGGAKFFDKSNLWHAEGSYNFSEMIGLFDLIVGGNFRVFDLRSEGTLFTLDNDGEEVSFNEYGAYLQMSKRFFDKVKVQGSIRYDKNQNFAFRLSPRVSAVWEFLHNNNLRASYQTGFRNPTTQNQYIDLDVVTRRLIGRNSILTDRYNLNSNPVYTTASVARAQLSGNVNDLIVANDAYKEFKTEKIRTWEVGYKGLILDGKLLLDVSYYGSIYKDFLAEVDVTQAVAAADVRGVPAGYDVGRTAGHSDAQKNVFVNGGGPGVRLQRYGVTTNIDSDIMAYGFGVGAKYNFFKSFNLGGNASFNRLEDVGPEIDANYLVSYNTPEWRYNISVENRKVTDRIGFAVTYRWQSAYLWRSAIGDGVIPAYGTLDAQISYKVPSINAIVKIGGSNLLNERYTTSFANPSIGALYYVQLNVNDILGSIFKK